MLRLPLDLVWLLPPALIVAACTGVTSAPDAGAPSPTGDAGTCGAARECRIARDCQAGGYACSVSDGRTGCCIQPASANDRGCLPNERCELRTGTCQRLPECEPGTHSACPPGSFCVFQDAWVCADSPEAYPAPHCTLNRAEFPLRVGQSWLPEPTFIQRNGYLAVYASGGFTRGPIAHPQQGRRRRGV